MFVLVLALPKQDYGQSSTIANISIDSAYALTQLYAQDPRFVILDVRTDAEYTSSHIENAVNLDYFNPDFASWLDSLPKTKIYLIHCGIGGRSAGARDLMANRGFQTVYNMLGGFNSWKTKYPVTQLTAPRLLVYGDSIRDIGYVPVGQTLVIDMKLTNGANDTLIIDSIQGPSNPKFSTNFLANQHLLGYDDYSFQLSYNPSNLGFDSTYFTIFSNGGNIKFRFQAHGSAVGIEELSANSEFRIYPNPATNYIIIENSLSNNDSYRLFNTEGRLIKSVTKDAQKQKLNISNLPSGMYFINDSKQTIRFIKK